MRPMPGKVLYGLGDTGLIQLLYYNCYSETVTVVEVMLVRVTEGADAGGVD